jgi:hypothetical protein
LKILHAIARIVSGTKGDLFAGFDMGHRLSILAGIMLPAALLVFSAAGCAGNETIQRTPTDGTITFRTVDGNKGELRTKTTITLSASRPAKKDDEDAVLGTLHDGTRVVEFEKSILFAKNTSVADIAFRFAGYLKEKGFEIRRQLQSNSIFFQRIYQVDGHSDKKVVEVTSSVDSPR